MKMIENDYKIPPAWIPQLTKPMLEKFQIPPITAQEETVRVLDNFDKLVNSISKGLSVEIKARRKQYKYYRNKLLHNT